MLDYLMHHFLVAVDGKIIAIGDNVSFRHAKTLLGARAFQFGGFS